MANRRTYRADITKEIARLFCPLAGDRDDVLPSGDRWKTHNFVDRHSEVTSGGEI